MSSRGEIILVHELALEEIVCLPNSLSDISVEHPFKDETLKWTWTSSKISDQFLLEFWSRDYNWFIQNAWSNADLLEISGPDTIELFLPHRYIIVVTCGYSWTVIKENSQLQSYLEKVAKWIGDKVGVEQLLFTREENLYSLEEYQSHTLKEVIDKFKKCKVEFQVWTV